MTTEPMTLDRISQLEAAAQSAVRTLAAALRATLAAQKKAARPVGPTRIAEWIAVAEAAVAGVPIQPSLGWAVEDCTADGNIQDGETYDSAELAVLAAVGDLMWGGDPDEWCEVVRVVAFPDEQADPDGTTCVTALTLRLEGGNIVRTTDPVLSRSFREVD